MYQWPGIVLEKLTSIDWYLESKNLFPKKTKAFSKRGNQKSAESGRFWGLLILTVPSLHCLGFWIQEKVVVSWPAVDTAQDPRALTPRMWPLKEYRTRLHYPNHSEQHEDIGITLKKIIKNFIALFLVLDQMILLNDRSLEKTFSLVINDILLQSMKISVLEKKKSSYSLMFFWRVFYAFSEWARLLKTAVSIVMNIMDAENLITKPKILKSCLPLLFLNLKLERKCIYHPCQEESLPASANHIHKTRLKSKRPLRSTPLYNPICETISKLHFIQWAQEKIKICPNTDDVVRLVFQIHFKVKK